MTYRATQRKLHHRAILFCRLLYVAIGSLCVVNISAVEGSTQVIVPDETLDAERSVIMPAENGANIIQGGAVRGANLFHSFEQFGIAPAGSALFLLESSSIDNIFSRVTGDMPSTLAGYTIYQGSSRR